MFLFVFFLCILANCGKHIWVLICKIRSLNACLKLEFLNYIYSCNQPWSLELFLFIKNKILLDSGRGGTSRNA